MSSVLIHTCTLHPEHLQSRGGVVQKTRTNRECTVEWLKDTCCVESCTLLFWNSSFGGRRGEVVNSGDGVS